MHQYTFKREPADKEYMELMEFSFSLSSRMYLIIRDVLNDTSQAYNYVNSLQNYLDRVEIVHKWPGTELFGGTAMMYYYNTSEALEHCVKNRVKTLYSWILPDLPEDIGFLRDDNSTILAVISHEKDAYICLTDDEYEQMRINYSALFEIIYPDPYDS